MLELHSDRNYQLHTIDKDWNAEINGIRIKAIPAKHDDLISDRDSIGFMFSANDFCVIYTGDTGWDDKIELEYNKIIGNKGKFKDLYRNKKYKLLVAHLGGFKGYEANHKNDDYDGPVFYKHHLGRLGLIKINEVLKPDVCFISEFGEELKGQRVRLAKIYDDAFENTTFLPADIGLTMDLENGKIKALTKVDLDEMGFDEGYIEPEKIHTRPLRKDFSLNYFDKNKVNEADMIEYLNYQYEKSIRRTTAGVLTQGKKANKNF
ncbi:MAG: hypothetical protein HUN04_19850 [Desulfobacter sp.]|nr:MAG: hypothetical protein HUN04_19850 [Desulfobacter sp.]